MQKNNRTGGFTLIELSIVLVIIGLLAGGVMAGQDLIHAATIRAQISQIEKYNTAVHTFQLKYGYLPGDIPEPTASAFGFVQRGQYAGEGDGNGLIEGISANAAASSNGLYQGVGETAMFWVDLSQANLIEGQFNTASPFNYTGINTTAMASYFPAAKLGNGNYIYVYNNNGSNYYQISAVNFLFLGIDPVAYTAISVAQAYNIDNKIDDGLPLSGNVTTVYFTGYLSTGLGNALGGTIATQGYISGTGWGGAIGSAAIASTISCYDNGGNASNPMQYSTAKNNGTGLNCALSVKMQ